MWSRSQIRRVQSQALQDFDHIGFLASQVAFMNLHKYGWLSPENVAAIRNHG